MGSLLDSSVLLIYMPRLLFDMKVVMLSFEGLDYGNFFFLALKVGNTKSNDSGEDNSYMGRENVELMFTGVYTL